MNCEILRTLYMKSIGDILCNDDYGEQVLLGRGTADAGWSASVLFANRRYQNIRESFARGRVPWPGVCEHCALLRRDKEYSDPLATKRIVKFQIEPIPPSTRARRWAGPWNGRSPGPDAAAGPMRRTSTRSGSFLLILSCFADGSAVPG